MKIGKTVVMCGLIALAIVFGGIAQANTISGSLWRVSEADANNAVLGIVPAGPADVTFDVNSPLNFDSRTAPNYTIGAFLATGSAFNIQDPGTPTLGLNMDDANGGTLLLFSGQVTVTNGMTFTVAHDDGLSLIIGGINLGFNPGPTSPTVTTKTYTGPSGTFAFDLVYGECCGAPAVLQVDLPFTNVPEPTTMLLLGLGLMGLAGMGRKLKE